MDDAMIIIITTLAATAGGMAIGYVTGKFSQTEKAHAQGWQEGFFYRIGADKARRDKLGRFKAKGPA
jgi:hypothetical protein